MDWTLQRPAKQARERNPEKVNLWMNQRWPAVKKRSTPKGLDLLPGRKRRLAASLHPQNLGPKGETPVLIHAFNWSKMSICAASGYRWDGRRSRLFFQTREGSYNTESLNCLPRRSQTAPAPSERRLGVGRITRPQEPRHAGVPTAPARLAHRGEAAWLCARPQSH